MPTFLWPTDDGWPYPDGEEDLRDAVLDVTDDDGDDSLLTAVKDAHLMDDLDPVERQVIVASFGLDGSPPHSVHQLHDELGLPDAAIEGAMGSGLAKLRSHLLR